MSHTMNISHDAIRGLASFDARAELLLPDSLPKLADFDGDSCAWLKARAEWAATDVGRAFDTARCAAMRELDEIDVTLERDKRRARAAAIAIEHSDTTRHPGGASFATFFPGNDHQRRALAAVSGWAELVISGEWKREKPTRTLILGGPVGTGKSHLAIGAVRMLVERTGISPIVWNAAALIRALNPFAHDDGSRSVERIIRAATSAPVLLVDDMGTRTAACTSNQLEGLFRIFNGRLRADRWNILTTNVGGIMQMVGGAPDSDSTDVHRIASRLADGGHLLPIGGRWNDDAGEWSRTYADQRGQA
jgi:DNA replication protein DnaC